MASFTQKRVFFFETEGAEKSIKKKTNPHVPGNAGKYFYFLRCYSSKAEEEEDDMDPWIVSMTWHDEDGKEST